MEKTRRGMCLVMWLVEVEMLVVGACWLSGGRWMKIDR